jgi:hypothetical protein
MSELDVGLPEGIDVKESYKGLEISMKWFSFKIIFLTFFAVFWNGFLVVWFTIALGSGSLLMALFPIIHVAVGIFLAYYVVAGYLNKTIITVNHAKLTIKHVPVPFFGNKDVITSDLKQLYSKEYVSRSKNGTSVSYHVHAILKNDKNIKLLSGLTSSEQALGIEKQIEKYLGIEDKSVKGAIN